MHSRTISGLVDELEDRLQKIHVLPASISSEFQDRQRLLFELGLARQTAHNKVTHSQRHPRKRSAYGDLLTFVME